MKKDKGKETLLLGLKLGIQSIAITACCSPFLVVIHLYAAALERGSKHWNLSRLPIEMYCGGGPSIVLLWFSLPYLFAGFVLAFLMPHLKSKFTVWISGAITGLFTGLIGNWLMANYFLISSLKGLYVSDWVLIGMMEIWSIGIFVWVENRANRTSTISNEAHV